MSEEQISAEMTLLRATENVVAIGKRLGYSREQVWSHLASAVGDEPSTLAIRRTQFDLVWPEGTS